MSAESGLPPEFQTRMQQTLGSQWEQFRIALASTPPVSIRKNPLKPAPINCTIPVPWAESGCYLDERPAFTLDPLFHAGTYYVQEASSMFLEQAFRQVVDLSGHLTVLDLCAAPGGKSTHILSLLNRDSLLVSNEVIRSRATILAENIQKWGHSNTVVTSNDPADFQKLAGFFDVVVLDAPCSGEGLFRKDAAAMEEWSPENVERCAARQKRILHDVWPALKKDGLLIYSTCTFNRFENEDVLVEAEELGAAFIPLTTPEAWGIEEMRKSNAIGYRFYPHRVKGEGFFLSVMRKTTGDPPLAARPSQVFSTPGRKVTDGLNHWLLKPGEMKFIQHNDSVRFFPKSKAAEVELLAKNLYLIMAGTSAATVKHDKYIPEHPFALSLEVNQDSFPCYELSLEQALTYLRKDALQLPGGRRGFGLVAFEGRPLGWVNVLDNRVNNLYPSSWRIRMAG